MGSREQAVIGLESRAISAQLTLSLVKHVIQQVTREPQHPYLKTLFIQFMLNSTQIYLQIT